MEERDEEAGKRGRDEEAGRRGRDEEAGREVGWGSRDKMVGREADRAVGMRREREAEREVGRRGRDEGADRKSWEWFGYMS